MSRCRRYELREHRSVAKFLVRHPNFIRVYTRLREEILQDPHNAGEPMKGKCKGLFRARKGRLRAIYRIEGCTVVIERVGLRENIYEGLC